MTLILELSPGRSCRAAMGALSSLLGVDRPLGRATNRPGVATTRIWQTGLPSSAQSGQNPAATGRNRLAALPVPFYRLANWNQERSHLIDRLQLRKIVGHAVPTPQPEPQAAQNPKPSSPRQPTLGMGEVKEANRTNLLPFHPGLTRKVLLAQPLLISHLRQGGAPIRKCKLR